MRASVRVLDGFTRILIEEYSSVLGEEGNRLLKIIRANTQKMGELIDGLLALSRLGREQIKMSSVDMAEMAQTIFEERKASFEGSRNISFKLGRLPAAFGDKRLIAQVFENLLSNALKFTRNEENAIIQVGYQAGLDEDIYYVRDNGVGFDMDMNSKAAASALPRSNASSIVMRAASGPKPSPARALHSTSPFLPGS
jgi:two-component system sensor kinase